jgi:HNH endonuclease
MRRTGVLILTKSFYPHRVVDVQKAINMVFSNRIQTVLETTEDALATIPYSRIREFPAAARAYNRTINDGLGDLVIHCPSVMSTKRKSIDVVKEVKFTRTHVYKRDDFTCQYCGKMDIYSCLNYDHVIPRSLGGRTNWENIVTSCYSCNIKKGGRTPEQAEMVLIKQPVRPSWHSMVLYDIMTEYVNDRWIPYIENYL